MSFIILCTGGSWQLVNGDEVYVRNNVKNYGLNLPPNIDHEILLQMVRSKADVLNSHICLSFKHLELGYVIELGDEIDVFQFRHVMSESKKTLHLYLMVVGEEAEEQAVVNNQFNPTKTNRDRRESQCDGNRSRGRGNEVPMGYEKKSFGY